MQTIPVDPRGTRWEVDETSYRVDFWQRRPGTVDGWESEEWLVSEADVHEVLAWAGKRSGGRDVVVWVCYGDGPNSGLIRLCGWEPTHRKAPPGWVTR